MAPIVFSSFAPAIDSNPVPYAAALAAFPNPVLPTYVKLPCFTALSASIAASLRFFISSVNFLCPATRPSTRVVSYAALTIKALACAFWTSCSSRTIALYSTVFYILFNALASASLSLS
jgi:hypothetical protein